MCKCFKGELFNDMMIVACTASKPLRPLMSNNRRKMITQYNAKEIDQAVLDLKKSIDEYKLKNNIKVGDNNDFEVSCSPCMLLGDTRLIGCGPNGFAVFRGKKADLYPLQLACLNAVKVNDDVDGDLAHYIFSLPYKTLVKFCFKVLLNES